MSADHAFREIVRLPRLTIGDGRKHAGKIVVAEQIDFRDDLGDSRPEQMRAAMLYLEGDRIVSVTYHYGWRQWCIETEFAEQRATDYETCHYGLWGAMNRFRILLNRSDIPTPEMNPPPPALSGTW